jgi:hypothetical protein
MAADFAGLIYIRPVGRFKRNRRTVAMNQNIQRIRDKFQ